MHSLLTYILDDDTTVRLQLCAFVQQCPDLSLVGSAATPEVAGAALVVTPVDLLFLDIGLSTMNGFRFLSSLHRKPQVIVVSADPAHAVEAFTQGVTDFLLKPFTFERFREAADRAVGRMSSTISLDRTVSVRERDQMLVKSGKESIRVTVQDIILVEGMGNYVKLHLIQGHLVVNGTMSAMEGSLPMDHFIRIHRSFIASRSAITSIGTHSVEVAGMERPLGGLYKRKVKAVMMSH